MSEENQGTTEERDGTVESDASNCVQNLTNKSAKLSKQSGVDEEEAERCDVELKTENEEETGTESVYPEQLHNDSTHDEEVLTPPQRIRLNVSVTAKPKVLVRSHAFSGDDDTGASLRHTPTSRMLASRSNFSSASFDSGHGHDYTDSTGINLVSFINCTLHKNAKDRSMLLQLEEHMTKLVKDPARSSQKFPAMSSYNRMLVHRVAAFFGLDHNVDQNGTAVVVNKTSHTRIPDIEFSSLIQGDVFTDEPRRYLRRDAQSCEEARQSLGTNVIFERRARSFEVGDRLTIGDSAGMTVGCTLPPTASLHMHLLHQQGSTSSTDASSTHLLESPGSCYSYGDMPVMGVYSPSEGSTSLSSTTHVFPWSSSESYTSSSADYPSNLISPVMHNHTRTPLLTRGVSIDTIAPPYRTFTTHSSFPEQRTVTNRRCNSDRHRSDAAILREASVIENPLSAEQCMEIPVSQQQAQPYTASADFIPNQYLISPVAESATYAVVPPYFRYTASTLPVQKLPQQMEALCISGYPETVSASPQSYLVPPQSVQTIYSQQFLVPSQVGAVYSPQPYFVPIVQRSFVPSVPTVQDTYSVVSAQHTVPNYDCNMQQQSHLEATGIAKSGSAFEGSTAAAETKNSSN